MHQKVLQAAHLHATRSGRVLYDRLGIEVFGGQSIHVVGQNGVGKTTLLRQLAGLSWLGHGKVDYFGHSVAYLGHQNALKPALTPLEHLQQAAALSGATLREDGLELFALKKQATQRCATLSAGQSRRLAFACLWAKQARIWLLDEPFCSLDESSIALISHHLLAHLSGGGSVVLTSHQTFFEPSGRLLLGESVGSKTVH